jgi:hypothetical protein
VVEFNVGIELLFIHGGNGETYQERQSAQAISRKRFKSRNFQFKSEAELRATVIVGSISKEIRTLEFSIQVKG